MVFVPGMDLSLRVPVLGEVCLLNAVWLPFALPALHFALRLKLRPLAAVSLVTALAHGVARYTSLFWSGYRLGNEIDAWFGASVLPARRWLPREICMWFMPPPPPTSGRRSPPTPTRRDCSCGTKRTAYFLLRVLQSRCQRGHSSGGPP